MNLFVSTADVQNEVYLKDDSADLEPCFLPLQASSLE